MPIPVPLVMDHRGFYLFLLKDLLQKNMYRIHMCIYIIYVCMYIYIYIYIYVSTYLFVKTLLVPLVTLVALTNISIHTVYIQVKVAVYRRKLVPTTGAKHFPHLSDPPITMA